MAFFTELSTGINKVIEVLISDETLCKLLYYNTPNAIYREPVSDPNELVMTKIFPFMKVPNIQTEANTFLCVFYDDIIPSRNNGGFRNESLKIAIIMHETLFFIHGAIRLYAISERIDTLFNNKYYGEIAGHSLQPNGRIRITQFNDTYYGWILSYSMYNESNVGIRT